jgi:hypothetical protein
MQMWFDQKHTWNHYNFFLDNYNYINVNNINIKKWKWNKHNNQYAKIQNKWKVKCLMYKKFNEWNQVKNQLEWYNLLVIVFAISKIIQ